jgi:BirA family biotin operon repressor/biotin-[acetyl-CoA-carboxylase] ligase
MTFDPEAFRIACRTRWLGRAIAHFPELPSTSAYLKDRARQGPPPEPGLLVIADSQTAGYGQHGRSWQVPPDHGLTFSLWLPAAHARPTLTLLAGVAVVEALRAHTGSPEIGLKWVNDLVARGRKLGGMLAEGVGHPRDPAGHGVVLGIGINRRDPGVAEAIALESLGPLPPSEPLLAGLLERLEARLALPDPDGLAAWSRYAVTLGQEVVVQTPHEVLKGHAEALSATGALILKQEDGTQREVIAGTVRLADGRYC